MISTFLRKDVVCNVSTTAYNLIYNMSKIYIFSKTSIYKILFRLLDVLSLFFKNNKIIKLKIALGIMLLTASNQLNAQNVSNNKKDTINLDINLKRDTIEPEIPIVTCYLGVRRERKIPYDTQKISNNKNDTKIKQAQALKSLGMTMCYGIVIIPRNHITLSSNTNYFLANKELYFSFNLAYEYRFWRKLYLGLNSEITTENLNFNGVLIGASFRLPISWRFYGNLLYQYGLYNSATDDFFSDYHSTGIEIIWRKRFRYGFGIIAKTYFTSTITSNPEFEVGAGVGVYYSF